MPRHQIGETGLVKAAPARVYGTLARPPFGGLVVEEGGTGPGQRSRAGRRLRPVCVRELAQLAACAEG